MLQNRGEFALILATLATAAGLDPRIVPFAGLYVLIMAVIGPILAVNSEKIGAAVFAPKKTMSAAELEVERERSRERDEGIALVEAALAGDVPSEPETVSLEPVPDLDIDEVDEAARQAAQQSDERGERRRDPEY
jgi:CPA2 family monovalent cation:H+ antiporter-2